MAFFRWLTDEFPLSLIALMGLGVGVSLIVNAFSGACR